MPKNPIVEAILNAGKRAVEKARRTFEGEFHGPPDPSLLAIPRDRELLHTPSHSMQGITLPYGWRRQPMPLLNSDAVSARHQQMAAEDAEVFAALDNVAAEGFDFPPVRRPTPEEFAAMTPEQRLDSLANIGREEIQQEVDRDILRAMQDRPLDPHNLPHIPLQISRVAPGPDGHYRVVVPGQMQGDMNLEDVFVNADAIRRVLRPEETDEQLAARLVRAGRDETPLVEAPEEVIQAILAGQRMAVSMGTRVDDPRFLEPSWVATPAVPRQSEHLGTFEPPRVRGGDPARLRDAMRGCSVCGGDHGMMDCPRIDGPTPNWGNPIAFDPLNYRTDEVVPGITPPRRVTVPTFEISYPTVQLSDIQTRRFDILDRGHDIGHQDYSQEIPSALRQEPHRNVPYDGPRPTAWEKITGEELIGD